MIRRGYEMLTFCMVRMDFSISFHSVSFSAMETLDFPSCWIYFSWHNCIAIFKQSGLAMAEPEHFGSTNHSTLWQRSMTKCSQNLPTYQTSEFTQSFQVRVWLVRYPAASRPCQMLRKAFETLMKLLALPNLFVTLANFQFEDGKSTQVAERQKRNNLR